MAEKAAYNPILDKIAPICSIEAGSQRTVFGNMELYGSLPVDGEATAPS